MSRPRPSLQFADVEEEDWKVLYHATPMFSCNLCRCPWREVFGYYEVLDHIDEHHHPEWKECVPLVSFFDTILATRVVKMLKLLMNTLTTDLRGANHALCGCARPTLNQPFGEFSKLVMHIRDENEWYLRIATDNEATAPADDTLVLCDNHNLGNEESLLSLNSARSALPFQPGDWRPVDISGPDGTPCCDICERFVGKVDPCGPLSR